MNGKAFRKHATSLVLIAASLGLGAYVLLVDRQRPTTEETEARKDDLLPVLQRDDVTRVVLEQDGHVATIVRRESDAGDFMYHLVEGQANVQDAPYADQVSVERLMQALEFAKRLRRMDSDFDRKTAGLDHPRMKLTVRMKSVTYRIDIGGEAKTPPGARYAELEGQGIFVIPRAQAKDMIRSIDAYRTRRIIPYTSTQVSSIEIEGPQGKVHLARGPWGGFRVENIPGKPRVSKMVFDRMLGAFANASAERFVHTSVAEKVLSQAKDKVAIALSPKTGDRAQLVVGGACPSEAQGRHANGKLVVLSRKTPNPLAACVPSSVLADLRLPASAFADLHAFVSKPDEVESIEIARGGDTLELIRKGEGWHVRKPEDQEIAADDVVAFLHGLLAIEGRIVAAPDAKELGLDPPQGKATLRSPALSAEKLPPQVIEIGRETQDDTGPCLAVRRKQDGATLLVPMEAAHLLQPSTTLIRSTTILDVNALHIRKVDVAWSDGRRQVVIRKGAGFDLQTPAGYEADASLGADLFDAVSHLKAERWVADRDDGSFGLQKPFVRVTFEVKDKKGDKTRTILLGAATTEGRYARWEKEADTSTGVFVLPRSLENTLGSWIIDRSGFMVDPNEVRGLTLRTGKTVLRIAVLGDRWQTAKGSSIQMPRHALALARRAFIDLRAEGTVHLGPAKADEGMDEPLLRITVEPRPEARQHQRSVTIGRGDVWRNTNIYYARRAGTDATFAIARSKLRPILEMMNTTP